MASGLKLFKNVFFEKKFFSEKNISRGIISEIFSARERKFIFQKNHLSAKSSVLFGFFLQKISFHPLRFLSGGVIPSKSIFFLLFFLFFMPFSFSRNVNCFFCHTFSFQTVFFPFMCFFVVHLKRDDFLEKLHFGIFSSFSHVRDVGNFFPRKRN